MLGFIYFQDTDGKMETTKSDVIKGSLSLGMIVGQVMFGILGDAIGRHNVYGRELIFTMFGTLMCVLLPWRGFSHDAIVAWMSVFRVVTGFGIGGGMSSPSQFPHTALAWSLIDTLVQNY